MTRSEKWKLFVYQLKTNSTWQLINAIALMIFLGAVTMALNCSGWWYCAVVASGVVLFGINYLLYNDVSPEGYDTFFYFIILIAIDLILAAGMLIRLYWGLYSLPG